MLPTGSKLPLMVTLAALNTAALAKPPTLILTLPSALEISSFDVPLTIALGNPIAIPVYKLQLPTK
jgi:hypothetical protein